MGGILIVDDLEFIRKTMKDLVTRQGWQVCGEAADGESALEVYEKCQPDVVLLDLMMPGMDGFGFLEGVSQLDPGSGARVIVCSAAVKRDMVMKALKMGAADFLAKPVDEERLVKSINAVLRRLAASNG